MFETARHKRLETTIFLIICESFFFSWELSPLFHAWYATQYENWMNIAVDGWMFLADHCATCREFFLRVTTPDKETNRGGYVSLWWVEHCREIEDTIFSKKGTLELLFVTMKISCFFFEKIITSAVTAFRVQSIVFMSSDWLIIPE